MSDGVPNEVGEHTTQDPRELRRDPDLAPLDRDAELLAIELGHPGALSTRDAVLSPKGRAGESPLATSRRAAPWPCASLEEGR